LPLLQCGTPDFVSSRTFFVVSGTMTHSRIEPAQGGPEVTSSDGNGSMIARA
jgi:hypothetical protein